VESAIFLFCRAFGKEKLDVGDVCLRKRSKNFQTYTAPWRIDKMKNHNNSMHPTKWAEYQKCASADKKSYFDTALSVNSEKTYFKLNQRKRKEITIEKDIIEVIIEDVLYFSDDEDQQNIQSDKKKVLIGFEPMTTDDDEVDYYWAIISLSFQYKAVLKSVGNGLSFQQTVNILDDFRTLTGMSGKFGNISRRVVTKYVHIYCLQTILEAMRHCWAFAIALDGGNKSSVPYLDYRLCFVLGHTLFNRHTCPMYESQTGENMFTLSSKVLSTLCPNWTEKLIGIITDGASNMTGCHAGLATRIERVANAGFFCIWCAAHQLDLVVQARFKSMFNEQFVHVIQGITGYLRRQKNLITSMKSTCPRFIYTRLLDWLIAKRLPLQAYFEEKQPPCRPLNEWWIEVYALAEVVSLINITFRELQGNQLLLDEQKKHLERLQENLMRIGSVVSTTDVLIQDVPGLFQLGCFCMTELFAESFLRNLGSDYILDVLKNYKDSCEI
jgi:hypothetical protein